ncbi:MAG: radical SAM protein [Thermotogota bacterium]|nr:radical SAM protein [Thermotogota bacterium]
MDITKKIDFVTKIDERRIKMGGFQPPPVSAKIELTARCSLRCKYCSLRKRRSQPKEDMDISYFKKIARNMRMSGVEEIGVFFIGESFMAPVLLVQAVEYCKKELEFPWVFLTSSGVNAKSSFINNVMKAGLDSLKWSVNTFDEKQFKHVTGGSEKTFKAIKENIKSAFEIRNANKYKTIISASSIQYDKKQEQKMQSHLSHNILPYVDKHYWLPMYNMGMYIKNFEEEFGYRPTVGNMGRIDEKTMMPNRKPLPCWGVFTEAHVRVDGHLSACCFGSDDKFDIGKLNGRNFMNLWNSIKFRELRECHIKTIKEGPKALRNTMCNVCAAYKE